MSQTRLTFRKFRISKRLLFPFILTLIVLGTVFVSPYRQVSGQTNPPVCQTCSESIARVIYAPTIDMPDAESSDIVLNCRSVHVMEAVPTFYTDDGQAIVGNTIILQPTEMRFVTVQSLIPAAHRNEHHWGGMSLSYTGHLLEVWAQITIRGKNQHGSSDVTFAMVNNVGADLQEAVWWMPKPGKAVIALGNSSSIPIHSDLTFSNGDTKSVDIAPFATEYVKRTANASGNSDGKGESVKVVTNGPAGSLKAVGYVIANNSSFTSSIRFYETPNAVQENLFATDFKVKNSDTHLLLKNTSTGNITAEPRFRPRDGAGTPFDLSPVVLAAGEIKELDLQPLRAARGTRTDLNEVNVQITNSGAPGSLIGALYSQNQNTGISSDIPLRDSGPLRNSTGAYPWRIDNDYKTTVVITNVGSEATQFNGAIVFNGGEYQLGVRELAAGQTAVYDIQKIRNEQIPDKKGHVISQNAKSGQFRWSLTPTSPSGARLIGRSEVVSPSGQVSISYSCPASCPDAGPTVFDWPVFYVGVGASDSFYVEGVWYDDYGYSYPGSFMTNVTSGNTGIATTTLPYAYADVDVGGVSAGSTTYSTHFWVSDYESDGLDCLDFSGYNDGGGDVDTLSVSITKSDGSALANPFRIGKTGTLVAGGAASSRTQHLKATVAPANTASSWTITVSSKVTLSNVSANNTTGIITFDVVGNAASTSTSDSSITASYSSVTLTKPVSVVIPSKVSTTHDTTGTYVAENLAADSTTSPQAIGLAAGKVDLITIYARFLTIIVTDQFGDLIGGVYPGAEVAESQTGTYYAGPNTLTSSSTYSDPVGEHLDKASNNIVDKKTPAECVATPTADACVWLTAALLPMVTDGNTQNYGVKVDGFSLSPAIVNRQWDLSSTNVTLTITWP